MCAETTYIGETGSFPLDPPLMILGPVQLFMGLRT